MFSTDCFLMLLQLLWYCILFIYMILILQKCVREMKFVYKFSINEISIIKCTVAVLYVIISYYYLFILIYY